MLNKFEKKIITSIRVIPVVVVIIFTAIITYILHTQNEIYFKNEELRVKQEYINSQKEIVKHDVQLVYDLIRYEKDNTTSKLKESLRKRVYEAHNIALGIYENNKHRSKAEIKKLIKDALVSIRFNDGRGYFFIYDFDGVNVLHPVVREFESLNLINHIDLKGKKVIKSLINRVKKSGEGFDTWYWNKPNDLNNEFEKIGFVKGFEPFNWLIGTGEYKEDFEKEVQKSVLKRIAQIKYDTQGYVFIIDYKGVYLNHIKDNLEGKNLIDLQDKNGVYLTKNIIEVAKNKEGFTQYISIDGTAIKDGLEKISFIKGFDKWQWAIGSGFNPALINERIKSKYESLQQNYEDTKEKIYISVASVLTLIIILLIVFSKEIESLFKKYREKNNNYQERLKNLLSDKTEMLDSSLDTIDKYVSITKTDLRGVITYATRNFCEGVGFTKQELIGKNHNIVRHPDTDPIIFKQMWEHIKDGKVFKTALKNRRKDGGEIWFELIINPDYDINKNITGYTAIRRNITDKKIVEELKDKLEVRVEESIQKSKEKDSILAQQAKMAAIGEMLENIAHQWRQPLSIISTAASGLELQRQYGLLDEQNFEDTMKTILDNTEYLSETIDNFRDFFNTTNDLGLLNLKDIFTKIKLMVDSDYQDSIKLIGDLGDSEVLGYENELIQILLNIINNSHDAFNKIEDKSYEKFIFFELNENKKNIVLTIKDNAGGIPEDILEKIFEPYFTTKHQAVGTGIGLYMCMEIITKQMQGKILVENKKYEYNGKAYKGAQFTIVLPLNPRKKLLKKIKKQLSSCESYIWMEEKYKFVKKEACSNKILLEDIEKITDFLHKFNIQYKILDNQDIILDFNKI